MQDVRLLSTFCVTDVISYSDCEKNVGRPSLTINILELVTE